MNIFIYLFVCLWSSHKAFPGFIQLLSFYQQNKKLERKWERELNYSIMHACRSKEHFKQVIFWYLTTNNSNINPFYFNLKYAARESHAYGFQLSAFPPIFFPILPPTLLHLPLTPIWLLREKREREIQSHTSFNKVGSMEVEGLRTPAEF